jgi:hypothetical protein
VVVANPRKVRLIYESDRKNDRLDARMLAAVPNAVAPTEIWGKTRGSVLDLKCVMKKPDALVRRILVPNQISIPGEIW